jgi:hypothetical protein
VRVLFQHLCAREVFIEWDAVACATVHALRLHAELFPDDPGIADVVAELCTE